jgi:AAA+ ATPase superfamily predicted ATPase
MTIIGRKAEMRELEKYNNSGRPELVILYGRRRVGKTYLIREYFENNFAFYFTGSINVPNKVNLANFDKAILEYGGDVKTASKSWSDAFGYLKTLLQKATVKRKVVFIDEMPWLDARKSDFLPSFDYFWNSWASANPEILLIGCGSATSWITKNIFKNKGGLHNRATGRIYLAPFSIGECEEFFKSRNVEITRYQLAECYMIFGGVPYYLNLFDRGLSFSQNVDKLCFSAVAPLRNEFEELYLSLYSNPRGHIAIVEALSKKKSGFTRNEICEAANLQPNGHLTEALSELEQCDFIAKYNDFTKNKNCSYYYLKDPFTLFYLRYMRDNRSNDEYFWTNYSDDGGHRAWSGYAFELLCRIHIKQIKLKLGILGVSTSTMSWRSKDSQPGAQIDLLISRKDGVINLCEMKYSLHPVTLTAKDDQNLQHKRVTFLAETGTRKAIHITMVATYGLSKKGYTASVQSEVTLNDLFQ